MHTKTDTGITNKMVAHYVQKMEIQKAKRTGILDTGATSGAALEEDMTYLEDTGDLSKKTFMFPDKQTSKATKRMSLKHKIWKKHRR